MTIILLLHRKWFYLMDFMASVTLLFLGFFEAPCPPSLELPVYFHTGIEAGCLMICLLVLLLKIRTRLASLWSQKRDVVKFALTFLLLLESCFVAGMGKVQWRLSRSFRPLFLIENFYMTGVRRFLKQFFKSLAPVFDIIVLMMFIIIVYSVLGFYLLGPTSSSSGSPYFQSFWVKWPP